MNEIVNRFLLAGDNFMLEMKLRKPAALDQPGFIYGACESFIKSKERIHRFKETSDSRWIYQKELDKAYFQHNIWLIKILKI